MYSEDYKAEYEAKTLELMHKTATEIAERFIVEVHRLIGAGAVPPAGYDRGVLFGVAMQNVTDEWLPHRSDRMRRKQFDKIRGF